MRTKAPCELPTGANPLPPLTDFEVIATNYNLSLQIPYGMHEIAIDPALQTGFFQHFASKRCGQFWLAAGEVIATTHLLPADVKHALENLSIKVPVGVPLHA